MHNEPLHIVAVLHKCVICCHSIRPNFTLIPNVSWDKTCDSYQNCEIWQKMTNISRTKTVTFLAVKTRLKWPALWPYWPGNDLAVLTSWRRHCTTHLVAYICCLQHTTVICVTSQYQPQASVNRLFCGFLCVFCGLVWVFFCTFDVIAGRRHSRVGVATSCQSLADRKSRPTCARQQSAW